MTFTREPAPAFSVILTTHDRPQMLAEAIDSVLSQTLHDFELVVVDDASHPPAVGVADPRVRVLRRARNGRPAAARNSGLDVAKGHYVCFLDDDDLYLKDRLATAVDTGDVSVCGAVGRQFRLDLTGFIPHVGQVTVRRELCPHFDERFEAVEDVDWWIRVSRYDVDLIPQDGYVLRHSDRRVSTDLRRKLDARLLLMKVHEGYFSTHPRASAYHWKRVGGTAAMLGERSIACGAFLRSLRARPSVSSAGHLLRAITMKKKRNMRDRSGSGKP
jgi:glycosyltransferase involved in cell wall biosynthesis